MIPRKRQEYNLRRLAAVLGPLGALHIQRKKNILGVRISIFCLAGKKLCPSTTMAQAVKRFPWEQRIGCLRPSSCNILNAPFNSLGFHSKIGTT